MKSLTVRQDVTEQFLIKLHLPKYLESITSEYICLESGPWVFNACYIGITN